MAVSDEGYQHIEHGFEPVFDEHSRVLVLGSFPSVLSRANAFYYGNPQNRFWRVMATCLGMPVPPNEGDPLASGEPATLDASIAAKRAMLLNGGVALWDVVESCDIKGSSDASIRNVVPAHIERITDAASIEVVVCNGGTAGRLYKRYLQDRTGLPAMRGERRSAAMPLPAQMATPPHHNWPWHSHALCRRTAVPRACSVPSCAARIAT